MSALRSGCPQEGGGGLWEEKAFWRSETCRAVAAAATHTTPCSAWLIHDHRWPLLWWHLTINRTDSIPFDHHHLSDSLVFGSCPRSILFYIGCSCSWNLIHLLAPVYYRCCVMSVAGQTVAAVVSRRRRCIGIHSHMTADEWWIMDWATSTSKWRERRRWGVGNRKKTDDCTLYAGVRASIQSAYAPEIAILLFAVDRYAPLHHH